MKLHLPKVLFAAVLACAAQAFATDYVYGTGDNNVAAKLTAPTADDTITFQKESGFLTAGGGTINAHVVVDQLKLTNGYSNVTYTFKNDVSGTGEFTIASDGTWTGDSFVFEGDMSSYSGAMSIANNKTATLTFKDSTGTGTITANNANSVVNIDSATINSSAINAATINVAGGESTVAHSSALTFTKLDIADGSSISVAEGQTLTLTGTVNVHTSNGTSEERTQDQGNGFGTADYTAVVGSGTWNTDAVTWNVNGQSGASYDAATHTLNFTGASSEYWFYAATGAGSSIADADGATHITVDTQDAANAIDMGNTDRGAVALDIKSGAVTVTGNDNSNGFVTGAVTIGAGATLQLQGHDALGYNNGEGKGSATPLIEMQGAEGNKAVLDNQDTSGGNPANLTFTTDLTLKGHTEVKNGTIKVFGSKVTATGTDNTIASNLVLGKVMTVEVTGSDDTLTISGNVSGGNAMTKTGEGALTLSGTVGGTVNNEGSGALNLSGTVNGTVNNSGEGTVTVSGTIGNNVGLNNTGSGTTVLDSVTLGGRVNMYNTTGTTITGGITSNAAANSYAFVVGHTDQATSAQVTMTAGTYNLGTNHIGIGTTGAVTVAEDAALTINNLYNSKDYVENNGALNVEGAVTVNGTAVLTTLNNEGEATFKGEFKGTNVNLKDGSDTAFNAAATITALTVTGDADLTIGGATTVANATTAQLNALTMKGGSTLSLGQHEDSLVTVKTLTVDGAATLNSDLAIAEDGALISHGILSMGCAVTIGSGTEITVDGDVAAGPVYIFTGVDSLTLGNASINNATWTDAAGYVINGVTAGEGEYVIGYWDGAVSIAAANVPEPATATLSLLALAALAARRRRR